MCVFLLSALRVTLRVHDKEQKIFGTICYLTPPPPPNTPSSAENYEQWAVLTFLRTAKWGGACAKPCRAGPMARRAALSRSSRPGQWHATARLTWRLSVRSPLLPELNPGECRRHWRLDTGAFGPALSSAQSARRYLLLNFIYILCSWPSLWRERHRFLGGADFFFLIYYCY